MSFNQINYAANRAWQQRTRKPLPRSTTELKRSALKPVSKKHAVEKREYSPVAAAYLEKHTECHHCIEKGVTPLPATEIHHVAGKEGALRNDRRFFMAVNAKCHTIDSGSIHQNTANAYERGWMISRGATMALKLLELNIKRGGFEHVQRELELWEEGQ